MLWNVFKAGIRAVNIISVVMLAGMYTFTYYDYLHTVTTNTVTVGQPAYSNTSLGTITIREQVSYQ